MENKSNKPIIWTVVVMLLILGAIGPIVPAIVRKINKRTPDDTIATRIYTKIDYEAIATKAVSLPIAWGFVNSAENTNGIGIKLFDIKRAFPHRKTIQVIMAGKSYYRKNAEPMQSDAEVRVSLSVIPKDGTLFVSNVAINAIRLFDFKESVQREFLQNKDNLTAELEKHISQKLMDIPIEASGIYEMTAEQIVFLSK